MDKPLSEIEKLHRRVFASEEGRRLLAVLCDQSGLITDYPSPLPENPVAVGYAQGQQDMMRHILRNCGINPTTLFNLTMNQE